MWRIFQFLSKFGNLILFFVLELLALVLVVNQNDKQNHAFQFLSLEFSGGVDDFQNGIFSYFYLQSENDILQSENANLKREVSFLRKKLDIFDHRIPDSLKYAIYPDSLLSQEAYNFIPCRTINNSVNRNYNFITLNKGENHGVQKGMGLLAPTGAVGLIISTNKKYSRAISILNKNFKLSARLLGNRNVGTLAWDGHDPEFCLLEYIPQTSPIRNGDTVVTTAFSTIFPDGYFIGTVESSNEDAKNGFHNIQVKLSTNFRQLDHLYLVDHLHSVAIDSLEDLNPSQ